jgi:hypothetical protein
MTLPTPPLPPSGRFTQYIRESSRALVQAEAVTVSVKYLVSYFRCLSPSTTLELCARVCLITN